MKKIITLLFVLMATPLWAQETYQGGCTCYGYTYGINIDECARAGYGGVRFQVRQPVPNGCGAEGGFLSFLKFPNKIYGMNIRDCCDQHDIAYGTCGLPQDFADQQLGSCIRQRAANAGTQWQRKALLLAGNAYQAIVEDWGVFAYRPSQGTLCGCSPCGANLVPLCMLGIPDPPSPFWGWPPWEPPPPPVFGGF